MTYSLQNFSEGILRSFIDNTTRTLKEDFNSKPAKTVDRFFRPMITALFDTLQTKSIHKRGIEILNNGKMFKAVSSSFSNHLVLVFLLSKTALNMSVSMAGETFSKNSKRVIIKVHDSMEAILPVASAIVAIASMNLVFIAGYFLHLGLSYLENNKSVSHDMRSICKYSAWMMGLSSLFLTNIPSSKFFP